jgi:hypothetical protein
MQTRSGGELPSIGTACQFADGPNRQSLPLTAARAEVEIGVHTDPLYQHLVVTAERKFWRCVENGEAPKLFAVSVSDRAIFWMRN